MFLAFVVNSLCFLLIGVFYCLQELVIREFSFHQLNANLLWPGTFAFAEWLVQNKQLIEGRRCIELGRYDSLKSIIYS